MRDLIVTQKGVFLVGREVQKSGPNKGQAEEVLSRKLEWNDIYQVSLSTRQDDFVVLHVTNSYDSLLRVPFKTELVTVLKKLMPSRVGRELKIVFADKIEFISEKSRLTGGKKRTILFENGKSDLEEVSAPGFMKNDIKVCIKQGLPNNSKPRKEVPKRMKVKANTGSSRIHSKGRNPVMSHQGSMSGAQPVRRAPTIPGPPRDPVPSSQPRHQPSVKHKTTHSGPRPDSGSMNTPAIGNSFMDQLKAKQRQNSSFLKRQESVQSDQDENMNFLQTPAGGKAKMVRESIYGQNPIAASRPLPAGGRPKPTTVRKPQRPKAKALYDYQAQDQDEISLVEGEILEIVKEDDSGWWTGKTSGGLEGFFPGTYVEKL